LAGVLSMLEMQVCMKLCIRNALTYNEPSMRKENTVRMCQHVQIVCAVCLGKATVAAHSSKHVNVSHVT
jgi:hypothetical protein